jgi:hypothetical protein
MDCDSPVARIFQILMVPSSAAEKSSWSTSSSALTGAVWPRIRLS